MTLKKSDILCLISQEDIFDFNTVTKHITNRCAKLECCPGTSPQVSRIIFPTQQNSKKTPI